MAAAKVLLIDPDRLFRMGVVGLLAESGFEVIGEGSAASEVLDRLSSAVKPEIVLLGVRGGGVEEAVSSLRTGYPGARIVVLADAVDSTLLREAFAAGTDGCLTKDTSPAALAQWMRLAVMGQKVFPSGMMSVLQGVGQAEDPRETVGGRRLSIREMQVLRCLLNGHSNKMIANHLSITEATVKVHLKSLLRKINASNRTQAAIWAMNNGVTDIQPVDAAN